ncbi:hypothetical protein P170DRAFT_24099 [Aspergillus steynii IBT 23096]|uniref:Uncharacterized protein n=1 Tax=Aspergillus steynii IBT 23096 TaxID=1392250 RepID=A0A2I2GPA0_9EURO|nr:uncharacterized protein P170DRAFT_24099 [Aspergillus steynii IBT 23096]PLB54698.1 hypothetical protein P170DRAFT_24099 [Aspergillus steynii IBT 23096]
MGRWQTLSSSFLGETVEPPSRISLNAPSGRQESVGESPPRMIRIRCWSVGADRVVFSPVGGSLYYIFAVLLLALFSSPVFTCLICHFQSSQSHPFLRHERLISHRVFQVSFTTPYRYILPSIQT